MYLKDQKVGIKAFSTVCHFSTIFGIMPYYDFEREAVIRKTVYRFYCVGYILLLTIIFIHVCSRLYYYADYVVKNSSTYTERILQGIIDVLSVIICLLTILGSAFWNMEVWDIFFRELYKIEQLLNKHVSCCVDHINFTFFLSNFLFSTCLICSNAAWINSIGWEKQYKYMLSYYFIFVSHVKLTLIYLFVMLIRHKFEELNNSLEAKYKKNILISVRTIRCLYRELCKTIETFNRILGWQLLFTIVYCTLVSINYFTIVSEKFAKPHLGGVVSNYAVLSSLLTGASTLVGPVLVMFSCDWAAKEAENIIKICYKYEDRFPIFSEQRKELSGLIKQAFNNKPAFTAAGFFQINRTTIFALLGTAVTYFVVVMQFSQTI